MTLKNLELEDRLKQVVLAKDQLKKENEELKKAVEYLQSDEFAYKILEKVGLKEKMERFETIMQRLPPELKEKIEE